jgi:hypothetical protein
METAAPAPSVPGAVHIVRPLLLCAQGLRISACGARRATDAHLAFHGFEARGWPDYRATGRDVMCQIYHKFYKSPLAGALRSVRPHCGRNLSRGSQRSLLTSGDAIMRRPSLHDQKVGDQLGELLRRTYDDVLREPLPDRLRDLIEKLESDRTLFFGDARATENSGPPLALEER